MPLLDDSIGNITNSTRKWAGQVSLDTMFVGPEGKFIEMQKDKIATSWW
jgi:hypothetical protein